MAGTRDVVIIGAGHNGLIVAHRLARAGLKPLVLERRPVVGGAAITDEFHPGFRCSTLAHASGPLRPDIAKEMRLERHGLRWIQPDPRVFAPRPDGRALILYDDPARTARELAPLSPRDSVRYPEFQRVLGRIGVVLGQV